MKKPRIYNIYKCPHRKNTPTYNLGKYEVTGRYCRNNCGLYKNRKCEKWFKK